MVTAAGAATGAGPRVGAAATAGVAMAVGAVSADHPAGAAEVAAADEVHSSMRTARLIHFRVPRHAGMFCGSSPHSARPLPCPIK